MVNNELLRRGEVIVEGDIIKARHIANQIALKSAVEKHDFQNYKHSKQLRVTVMFQPNGLITRS
jgi:hypothetical protein